jgi:MYXO-CTERM domain-containing protein
MLLLPRRLFLSLAALALLLLPGQAAALGQVQWKSTTIQERSTKSWQLELTVTLPKAPDFAHMPMKFEFLPTAYHERAMMDGDKLVERWVPLVGRQPSIESVDVGFLDPGSGKIEKRTRFSFKVTRGQGYEAGEYKVTIRESRNGQIVGTPQTLRFVGENEIIDRRAIVFSGERKKPEKPKAEPAADPSAQEEEEEEVDLAPAPKPTARPGDEEEEEDDDLYNDGTIREKPGGCGCQLAGPVTPGPLAALGLLLLGSLTLRRRR